jgi:lipoprotein-anchoring transpeptidase ErfK/SrfK
MLRRTLSVILWFSFFSLLIGAAAAVTLFWEWRKTPVNIALSTEALAGPHEALVVSFSEPVWPASIEAKLTLEGIAGYRTEWHDFDRKLVILPATRWPLDVALRLTIGPGRTKYFRATSPTVFTIASPRIPRIVATTPADGAGEVLLGIEDPIRVEFDRSVKDFFIDFAFDPPLPVVYRNNPEKTIFEILPEAALVPARPYTLTLSLRWRDEPDTALRPLGAVRFTTLPERPEQWSRDLAVRSTEAKRFTRPKRREGKYIDVNLAGQMMTIFENGRALDAYPISSGQRGMETPKGEFRIENKALRPWSKRYSLYMPYWQAITPDGLFGIHELPEWPGGYKEGANHLGIPVSHGCVRLGIGPAKRIYEWAEVGTPVVIY